MTTPLEHKTSVSQLIVMEADPDLSDFSFTFVEFEDLEIKFGIFFQNFHFSLKSAKQLIEYFDLTVNALKFGLKFIYMSFFTT